MDQNPQLVNMVEKSGEVTAITVMTLISGITNILAL